LKSEWLKTIFFDTVAVFVGYIFLGAGFGILLAEAGYNWLWALCMSVVMYAGSGQYLAVTLMSDGSGLLTAAVATLLVNARHIFYGISLLDTYKGAGLKKCYMIFGLTDETYSLVTQARPPKGMDKMDYCFYVTLFDHCYWVTGCVLGCLAGTYIPISFEGVEFVLTALFVTLFVGQWLSTKDHLPALTGVAMTALCLVIFGKKLFLIPAMVLIAATLLLIRKGKEAPKIEQNNA